MLHMYDHKLHDTFQMIHLKMTSGQGQNQWLQTPLSNHSLKEHLKRAANIHEKLHLTEIHLKNLNHNKYHMYVQVSPNVTVSNTM